MKNYLNFETDIKTLEGELEKLKDPYNQEGLSEVDTNKISKTQEELDKKLKEIYSSLDPLKGGYPQRSMYNITPMLQRSHFSS